MACGDAFTPAPLPVTPASGAPPSSRPPIFAREARRPSAARNAAPTANDRGSDPAPENSRPASRRDRRRRAPWFPDLRAIDGLPIRSASRCMVQSEFAMPPSTRRSSSAPVGLAPIGLHGVKQDRRSGSTRSRARRAPAPAARSRASGRTARRARPAANRARPARQKPAPE